jgi:hypothetical protein
LTCRYYSGQVANEPDARTPVNALNYLKSFTCVIGFNDFGEDSAALLKNYNIPSISIPHERKKACALLRKDNHDII